MSQYPPQGGYPPQGYPPPQGYAPQPYPPQGYPPQGYPPPQPMQYHEAPPAKEEKSHGCLYTCLTTHESCFNAPVRADKPTMVCEQGI
ncbi:predicted protein [Chaetomium globosum CBS 148.51]|uniref:Rhodopsin n=1 Tax=Chaetomium globosum (strain ATCC 6205 / CBS 148.51 / DSM 1962 / NBRC 6347 / NRRL 1970) TaxID=306901 RepID=Q2H3S9_CHAGB|nr:uncharacterized protein CHGG_06686 [Chaetomium globosum CBS 148.51]EAQ90067.1 predicted protein [Chaetomium globosum CBS 148.51]